MPIVVQHDVDPALTAALSFIGSQNQYLDRQAAEELARRTQAQNLATQLANAAQQGRDVARERSQQASQPVYQQRPGVSNRDDRYELRLKAQMARRDREAQLAIAAMQAQGNIAQNEDRVAGQIISQAIQSRQQAEGDQLDFMANREGLANQAAMNREDWASRQAIANDKLGYGWDVNSAEALEADVNTLQADMAKQRKNLTPEGLKIYGDLTGKLRAIQRARATVKPEDYTRLLGQWLDEFNASGVQDHVQEPPTPEQMFNQSAFRIDDRNAYVVDPATGKGTIQEIKAQQSPEEREHEFRVREKDLELKDWDIYKAQMDAWSKSATKPPEIGQFIRSVPSADGTTTTMSPDFEAYSKAYAMWQQAENARMQQMPQPPAQRQATQSVQDPGYSPMIPEMPFDLGVMAQRLLHQSSQPAAKQPPQTAPPVAPPTAPPEGGQPVGSVLDNQPSRPVWESLPDKDHASRKDGSWYRDNGGEITHLLNPNPDYPDTFTAFRYIPVTSPDDPKWIKGGRNFILPDGRVLWKGPNGEIVFGGGKYDLTPPQAAPPTPPVEQQQPEAPAAPVQVNRPEELQEMVRSGHLHVGDTVMTPRGPKEITEEVYRKLMGQ